MTVRSRVALVAVLLVFTAACRGNDGTPLGPSRGSQSPVGAVEELVSNLDVPDFDGAAPLAMPGHAALASLAEGASFGDVAEALRGDGLQVSANFWAGFAQGAGSFLAGDIAVADSGTESVSDVTFHRVRLTLPDGSERSIFTQDADGHRIDLFASFGGGMAARMIQPAERILITQTEDARLILAELKKVVPSLTVAASNPDLLPTVINDLTRLIEIITRAG